IALHVTRDAHLDLKKAVTGYGVIGEPLPSQSIYSLGAKLIWHIQKEPKMGKLCSKFYHCQTPSFHVSFAKSSAI
ncbi:MAG: hypothetical protein WBF29_07725, partial [Syntrophobacteria bacterium]